MKPKRKNNTRWIESRLRRLRAKIQHHRAGVEDFVCDMSPASIVRCELRSYELAALLAQHEGQRIRPVNTTASPALNSAPPPEDGRDGFAVTLRLPSFWHGMGFTAKAGYLCQIGAARDFSHACSVLASLRKKRKKGGAIKDSLSRSEVRRWWNDI